MGITKTNIYTQEQNDIANLAKAFAHPARVAILEHLLEVNTCINGDLVKEIGLAQATISQHLKELKKLELIQGNISGNAVCYCINPIKWLEVNKIFNQFIGKLKMNNCC